MATFQTVIITSIREEAPGVKTFTIAAKDGAATPYAAGQFITFAFTHHGREERRSFSISSCAVLGEPLSFTVKRVDNGAYSRLLVDRAAIGDKLYTTGAAGLFTLPANIDAHDQFIFFAAGIGITPIYPIIKTLLNLHPDKYITLIYSNRTKEETVFYNELQQLLTQYVNFRIEFLYSTSFNLVRARLSKSLLSLLLREYARVPRERILCYVCGPFAYMRMVIFGLEEQGIDDAQIRKENFNTNDRQVRLAEPPDKENHTALLKFGGREYAIPVVYPDTILQAAKKQGLSLPYSCEVGRCGSCAAICTSGKVWLSYNEVLMDTDLAHGSILTCTGHPIGGDVTIAI